MIRGSSEERRSEDAFRTGYGEVRDLTDLEEKTLPLFEGARQFVEIGIPAMNLYHWGSAHLSDYWINRALDRLRQCLSKLDG